MARLLVRGSDIYVHEFVVYKIPLIEKRVEKLQQDGKGGALIIDEIAPNFMRHIVEYMNNEQKPLVLKQKLDAEFEKTKIIAFLKILGLDSLIHRLYDFPETIEGKPTISHIQRICDFSNELRYLNCILRDGTKIPMETIDTTAYVCQISGRLIKETSQAMWFEYKPTEPGMQNIQIINKCDIITDIRGYFMFMDKYLIKGLHEHQCFDEYYDQKHR